MPSFVRISLSLPPISWSIVESSKSVN